MTSLPLHYTDEGLDLQGRIYLPDQGGGPHPAVLVYPDVFGMGPQVFDTAQRLAALGYAALACDLHGHGRLFADVAEGLRSIAPMQADPLVARSRATSALTALTSRPEVDSARIAAIGYCIGGTLALELARGGTDVKGVVGFHAGLTTTRPDDAAHIKGRVLVCLGADDPAIDATQRTGFEAEMRAAKVDWQMNLYGNTVHSFTNQAVDAMGHPEFARYSKSADERSWADMRAFLTDVLGPVGPQVAP